MTVGQQLIIAAIPGFPALVFLILALFGRYLRENAQFIAIIGLVFSLVFSSFSLAVVAGVTGLIHARAGRAPDRDGGRRCAL